MNKLIVGKPITGDRLQELLDGEKNREKLRRQLETELKGIKKGEGLSYEVGGRAGASVEIALAHFVEKVAGLKMITEDDRTYIYREK